MIRVMVQDGILGDVTGVLHVPLSADEVKIIESESRMPFVRWWKQQQSAAHGDDILNWQFNLLMILWIHIIHPAYPHRVSVE